MFHVMGVMKFAVLLTNLANTKDLSSENFSVLRTSASLPLAAACIGKKLGSC